MHENQTTGPAWCGEYAVGDMYGKQVGKAGKEIHEPLEGAVSFGCSKSHHTILRFVIPGGELSGGAIGTAGEPEFSRIRQHSIVELFGKGLAEAAEVFDQESLQAGSLVG